MKCFKMRKFEYFLSNLRFVDEALKKHFVWSSTIAKTGSSITSHRRVPNAALRVCLPAYVFSTLTNKG